MPTSSSQRRSKARANQLPVISPDAASATRAPINNAATPTTDHPNPASALAISTTEQTLFACLFGALIDQILMEPDL